MVKFYWVSLKMHEKLFNILFSDETLEEKCLRVVEQYFKYPLGRIYVQDYFVKDHKKFVRISTYRLSQKKLCFVHSV